MDHRYTPPPLITVPLLEYFHAYLGQLLLLSFPLLHHVGQRTEGHGGGRGEEKFSIMWVGLNSGAHLPGFGQVPLQLEHLHVSCLVILAILCEVGGRAHLTTVAHLDSEVPHKITSPQHNTHTCMCAFQKHAKCLYDAFVNLKSRKTTILCYKQESNRCTLDR